MKRTIWNRGHNPRLFLDRRSKLAIRLKARRTSLLSVILNYEGRQADIWLHLLGGLGEVW